MRTNHWKNLIPIWFFPTSLTISLIWELATLVKDCANTILRSWIICMYFVVSLNSLADWFIRVVSQWTYVLLMGTPVHFWTQFVRCGHRNLEIKTGCLLNHRTERLRAGFISGLLTIVEACVRFDINAVSLSDDGCYLPSKLLIFTIDFSFCSIIFWNC